MNISCRIANADTQCGRITNPPERVCLIPGCYYQNPVEFNDFNNFHNSHNRVQDWIKNTR